MSSSEDLATLAARVLALTDLKTGIAWDWNTLDEIRQLAEAVKAALFPSGTLQRFKTFRRSARHQGHEPDPAGEWVQWAEVEADRLRLQQELTETRASEDAAGEGWRQAVELNKTAMEQLADAEATITTLRAQIQEVAAKLAPARPSFSDLFDGAVPSSSGTRICLDMMQIQDHEAWMAAGLQRWMKVDDVERHMRQFQQELLKSQQPAEAVE